jgi:hypothetical protein
VSHTSRWMPDSEVSIRPPDRLEHTRDFRDIMYYFGYGGDVVEYFDRYRSQLRSRDDIQTVSGLSAADVNRIRALYGGE